MLLTTWKSGSACFVQLLMIAQFTTTKHTDHFGLVNGTIWQLFKSKLSIQNLIGIHFCVSRSSSTQNVMLTYYLAGWQA